MTLPRVRLTPPLISGARRLLEAAAAHHARDVLRRRTGEPAIAFDGEGHECDATFIVESHEVALQLGAARPVSSRSPLTIRLVLCLPKGDKLEWVLEKATELGVSSVYPAQAQRSVVRLDAARARARAERWTRIAEGAARQSERADVPLVHGVADLATQLRAAALGADLRLCCQERLHEAPSDGSAQHPDAPSRHSASRHGPSQSVVTLALPVEDATPTVAVVVGPEGGLTDSEQALAQACGYTPWSLGPRILRAETAAITAVAILQHALGDLARE